MKLLYLTTNFRALTLTFVTREVRELRESGVPVDLLSLRRETAHAAARPECDLEGSLHLFPLRAGPLASGLLRVVPGRPRRFLRAVAAILRSRGDGPATRVKLLGQLLASTTVVAEIERRGVTHIHAHLASPPGNYAMFLSLLTGIPFSFTGHAADLFRRPESLATKLRLARGSVAISRFNLEHYRQVQPRLGPAVVVHCGVDPDRFPFRQRERCHDPLRVLAVGRATEKKGFRHLLAALALLDRRPLPWEGRLVGGGELLEPLRAEAAALSLDRLAITGPAQQAEIRDLLHWADVFVLPCVRAADGDVDGIPVALMEAMAAGCPVISSRLSGIPELVEDGQSGLLTAPGDAAGIADGLARLAREPELTAALSRGGRARVEREFDQAREAARLRRFFQDLARLDGGPRRDPDTGRA